MSPCLSLFEDYLSLVRGLSDELNRLDAEVRVAAGGHLDSVGRIAGEVTGDGSVAAVRAERRDDEADPADDVVFRVRARPGEQAVDREENLGAERFTVTVIVSLLTIFEEIEILPEPRPPFLAAYC